jgi:hypothetical protein
MTRSQSLVILAGLLFAGAALGQAPHGMEGLPVNAMPLEGTYPGQPPVALPVAQGPPAGLTMAGPVGGGYSLWASANYVLGWVSGDPLPPLVTTGPPGTPRAAAGALPIPQTTVLFGRHFANDGLRSGAKVELGYWFDPGRTFGIEGGGFGLGGESTVFQVASSGSPILARPFIDATTGLAATHLVAFPGDALGASAGTIRATDTAHRFYGFNLDLRENVVCTPGCRLDCLLGYRFLDYGEHLEIQETLLSLAGPLGAGTTVRSLDRFATRNVFNGIETGLRADWSFDSLSLGVLAKVAGGHLAHGLENTGLQQVAAPGATPVGHAAGLLVQSSNNGAPGSHSWTYVPEVGINLGWELSENIRLRAGYSSLWLLNAARRGDRLHAQPKSLSTGQRRGRPDPAGPATARDLDLVGPGADGRAGNPLLSL